MITHTPVKPVPPFEVFLGHLVRSGAVATGIVLVSLAIGMTGYRWFEHMPWIDALLNSAMILTQMGPVDHPQTTGGKLFATGYALFCGPVILATSALVLKPVFWRSLHRLHLDIQVGHGA